MNKVRDNEKGVRDDLSLLAASYLGQLKKRSKPAVPSEEFYTVRDGLKGELAPKCRFFEVICIKIGLKIVVAKNCAFS